MKRVRHPRAILLAALAVLGLAAFAWAQDQSAPTPPPNGGAPAGGGAPASGTTGPVAGATTTPAAAARTVAVDATGGPATLESDLTAAITAWKKAAPDLVSLTTDPKAASTVGYAAPALLGPDTLSLDLRVPGQDGVEVRVAAGPGLEHPMVLLHEVGVLLGLPEGGGGVMAFAVPASAEPDAPTPADVQTLRAQRSYAREDLNRDGTVDFYDLVLFGQAFGAQGVNLPADFNGDGRVDRQDLAMLEKAYTFTPPSNTAPSGTASSKSPAPPAAPGASPSPAPSGGDAGGTTPPPSGSSGSPPNGSSGGSTGSP